MTNKITDTFTVDEWKTVKEALRLAGNHARSDERENERVLAFGKETHKARGEEGKHCDECFVAENNKVAAAFDAMRFEHMAEKIKV